ncbi:putative NRPS-like protein biosynthetic cluster [Aspergillus viridinutans]|uniref:NRPS-like protein biosynthetic cluster n=1 Tax=Aspergillus viridinutans TaxID=75553 RepID=A0A9P3C7D6_ASPVI|nr:putative NRPS-like protein biosynthetic cluster [Aspergillus viridinutans]GIK06541.1 putative NRPS-like protein biosynthetic cluster [Aspergillus viridinutans]
MIPPKVGKLPNEPFFERLVKACNEVQHVVIHDPQNGVDANYTQLFTDVLKMRQAIYEALPRSMFDGKRLIVEETPFIFILAPGNYEFIVASFAILGLGGAIVPLCMFQRLRYTVEEERKRVEVQNANHQCFQATSVLPEEAHNLLQRCNSSSILAAPQSLKRAIEIQQYVDSQQDGGKVAIVPITIKCSAVSVPQVEIDKEMTIAPTRPSLVLFTSGTTGPPKGVVHDRTIFYTSPGLTPDDVLLSHRPVHWVSGTLPLIKGLMEGSRVEITEPDVQVIWERLRKGGVTLLTCGPPMYTKLMKHFQEGLNVLSPEERDEYVRGARGLRLARVSGQVSAPSMLRFWREVIGKPLTVCYGSTEMASRALQGTAHTDAYIDRCIGRPVPGVTVKLSEGDHGELLIKGPSMFSHYLNDEAATRAAFDDEGFYRTGDLAHRVGDQYVLDGRASADFVRHRGGYKVPVLEVEAHLLELPYISEAYILSVPDLQDGARVAALVRLRVQQTSHGALEWTEEKHKVDLRTIRSDLADKLSKYKLPTALRILQDGETVPETRTGKPIRKQAVERYFPVSEDFALPAAVEVWDFTSPEEDRPARAWDWAGLQKQAI